MSLDGFFLRALIKEIKQDLIGGHVRKIYQPYEHELEFVIRNNRKNFKLLISAHSRDYRLHLTQENTQNPAEPPMFCMVLRKHLESSQLLDIKQVDNDRIVILEFSGRDEIGDLNSYKLIVELMGKHSNITLVTDDFKIIDSIKRIPPSVNSYRTLLPNNIYKFPPKHEEQTNIYSLSSSQLREFCDDNSELIRNNKANQIIQGLSKQTAQTLSYWCKIDNKTSYEAVNLLLENIEAVKPTLFFDKEKNKYYFYAFLLPQFQDNITTYPSLSKLLEDYYHKSVTHDRIQQLIGSTIQNVERILNKNKRKLKNLNKDLQKAEKAQDYKLKGELLSVYAHTIEKGATKVTLDNYYEEGTKVEIDLKPELSAIENSQRYYKRYSKYRDSKAYIDEQIKLTIDENAYLESVLLQLEHAEIEDVEIIRQELEEEGYIKTRAKNKKRKKVKQSSPRRFESSDGVLIEVGKNNKQNDALSTKTSNKNFIWLHAKNIPGSHVVIHSEEPSEDTVLEAASLAAYYSKYQASANVPVDVLPLKKLNKPKGAKPGFVTYEGQRTVYVTPSEKLVEDLKI